MKEINIDVSSIKVSSFSPARQDVSFVILFNDGKEKEITKTMQVKPVGEAVLEIIKAIRGVENTIGAEFDGKSVSVLDNHTNIKISNEDKVTDKLTAFVSKVFDNINRIKNQTVADGYMQLIANVNSMKTEF